MLQREASLDQLSSVFIRSDTLTAANHSQRPCFNSSPARRAAEPTDNSAIKVRCVQLKQPAAQESRMHAVHNAPHSSAAPSVSATLNHAANVACQIDEPIKKKLLLVSI